MDQMDHINLDGNRMLLNIYSFTQKSEHLQKLQCSKYTGRRFCTGIIEQTKKSNSKNVHCNDICNSKMGKVKCPTIRSYCINYDASRKWSVWPLQINVIKDRLMTWKGVCNVIFPWRNDATMHYGEYDLIKKSHRKNTRRMDIKIEIMAISGWQASDCFPFFFKFRWDNTQRSALPGMETSPNRLLLKLLLTHQSNGVNVTFVVRKKPDHEGFQ